jgi:hypothetical protein
MTGARADGRKGDWRRGRRSRPLGTPGGSRPVDAGGATSATVPVSLLRGQMAIFGRDLLCKEA